MTKGKRNARFVDCSVPGEDVEDDWIGEDAKDNKEDQEDTE